MSTIRIEDLAYVRFRAPDLTAMEAFLDDFGLERAMRTESKLYARAADGEAFVHVTELGQASDAGFVGLGLRASSVDDLETLATHCGARVAASTEPGGGSIVRLTDPDGFAVEVVAGRERSAPRTPTPREPTNDARARPRKNVVKRIAAGASRVQRLGHCVLNVKDFRASESWYKDRFGFITSDEIMVDGLPDSIGAFLRCDRGSVPTDHHTLFLVGSGSPKFNHAAFEVVDFDDLMAGHEHLTAKQRQHEWGVGRHVLGSQIFDYWRDPWGHTLEHWTDGDLLNAEWGSRKVDVAELLGTQWGPASPPSMA
jgi:catechol 2,3-dioxygenase-like lactoylglutathione lyase family enzyme